MNSLEQLVTGFIIPPQIKTTSASATVLNTSLLNNPAGTSIDTAGYGFLKVTIGTGAVSGLATAFKLQESAAVNMAGAVDINFTVFGGAAVAGVTPPVLASVVANGVYEFYIDLGQSARLRYIAPVVTIDGTGTGDYVTAFYELTKQSGAIPFDDTSRGVVNHVRG